jgi:hypothetical protein
VSAAPRQEPDPVTDGVPERRRRTTDAQAKRQRETASLSGLDRRLIQGRPIIATPMRLVSVLRDGHVLCGKQLRAHDPAVRLPVFAVVDVRHHASTNLHYIHAESRAKALWAVHVCRERMVTEDHIARFRALIAELLLKPHTDIRTWFIATAAVSASQQARLREGGLTDYITDCAKER